ncbi:TolC family protein [Ancylomarina sp. 16SWW S1-10-2]|uniref:TolC family protein n=1 Tax=Ancylomarina sp. 16SWW S1-10-2 TaxID=2499681 RepID=UPI0012AEA468|nr:TolC family protein [Ancylomarina sp. 16SWW S1-10-2]MRT93542.1 TolC family protein [Ancylomarina sp. 16SWW S1-10-2]
MRNITCRLIIFLVLFSPLFAVAQSNGVNISLKEALLKAEENNKEIKKSKSRVEIAKANYQQSNSLFLPGINLSHTAVRTNDPLASFGFKLKQEVVTSGDFNPVLLNDPGSMSNFQTQIKVEQPLLNFDGIYERKAAKLGFDAVSLQSERMAEYVKFEVKKAYKQLQLAQEAVNVFEKVKAGTDANLKQSLDFFEEDLIKEADVLAAKVRALEVQNNLNQSINQRQGASDYLAFLIGMESSDVLSATDVFQEPLMSSNLNDEKNNEDRSDILAYKKGVSAKEQMLKSARNKFLPRINAFGAYEWNDKDFLGTSANNYMIGASLSWDLFKGYKNIASVKKAKAELQLQKFDFDDYLEQNNLKIKDAKRSLILSIQKIETGRLAKEQSEEALRIRTNRFKQGLEKMTDLIQSETLYASKNLEYLNAINTFYTAKYYLEFLLEKELK